MKRPRQIKRKYFQAEVVDHFYDHGCDSPAGVMISSSTDILSPKQCRAFAAWLFKAAIYLDKETPHIQTRKAK